MFVNIKCLNGNLNINLDVLRDCTNIYSGQSTIDLLFNVEDVKIVLAILELGRTRVDFPLDCFENANWIILMQIADAIRINKLGIFYEILMVGRFPLMNKDLIYDFFGKRPSKSYAEQDIIKINRDILLNPVMKSERHFVRVFNIGRCTQS